jgi:hypothetical protein
VFLTNKFKEKNECYIPTTFLNAMTRNIKIHNIFYNIEISKSIEPNKCIQFFLNDENIYLSVSYDFSKFNGSMKIMV